MALRTLRSLRLNVDRMQLKGLFGVIRIPLRSLRPLRLSVDRMQLKGLFGVIRILCDLRVLCG